jgi:glycosyltransferase involved in cell wall biosynthesis
MKTQICHVASNVSYSLYFEAIGKFLDRDKYELKFVFLNPDETPIQRTMSEYGIEVDWIKYESKADLPKAISQLRKIFKTSKPNIVHTHLLDASLAGLVAAYFSGIRARVHTRHHATECHVYYPHAVYYDRLVNRLSKRIVATTRIVKDVLVEKEGVREDKVSIIHLGYDMDRFKSDQATVAELKQQYRLNGKRPVVGVISRFVKWKGVQYIIPAFARLAKVYPEARLVLAGAEGSYSQEINSALKSALRPEQYVLIPFETRIFNLYKTFDLFVHVPIECDSEAFGQTYLEALYMEVPSVFTLSGVAHDFIRHHKNALVVPHRDSEGIYQAITALLQNKKMAAELAAQGKRDVMNLFRGERLANELDHFYAGL